MRNILTKCACVVAIALLVNVGPSHAGVIVSNLGDSFDGEGTIYGSGPPQYYAQEFNTGSQSGELCTIIAALGAASGTFTPFAELVADNGGAPTGTVLTDLTVPTIPTGLKTDPSSYSNLTLTPTTMGVMLGANTNYWLVLGATGTGDYHWQYTNTLDPSSFPNYASSHDGTTWTNGAGGPFLMQVNSVPEPSSSVLGGLAGLIGFGVVVGRKFRAQARG